jgi:hypothetical protein
LYEQIHNDNPIVMYGPAIYLDSYHIDKDEVTGLPLAEGITLYCNVSIELFTKYFDAAKRRTEARDKGEYSALDELLYHQEIRNPEVLFITAFFFISILTIFNRFRPLKVIHCQLSTTTLGCHRGHL